MADILNLNRHRKAKCKAAKERQASENRVRFGRSKAQKQLEKAQEALKHQQWAEHSLTKPPQEDVEG